MDRPVVTSSYCTACDVLVHWRFQERGSRAPDIEALDSRTGTNFPCDHWQDHHTAVTEVSNIEGPYQWSERMVVARRLTENPSLKTTDHWAPADT
jgi:hypothetical protein